MFIIGFNGSVLSTVIDVPPTTESTPPPPAVEDTVKLGYVPVIVVPPAPVKATVWSGAVFVIIGFAGSVLSTPIEAPATTESRPAPLVDDDTVKFG